jgi:hypothetical protein
LLQNCFTDILLLFSVLFSDPVGYQKSYFFLIFTFLQSYFFTSKGEVEFILNGIWQTQNADLRWINLALLLIWHFLTYVSLFGFVNQFIYRYLVLNWYNNKNKFIPINFNPKGNVVLPPFFTSPHFPPFWPSLWHSQLPLGLFIIHRMQMHSCRTKVLRNCWPLI